MFENILRFFKKGQKGKEKEKEKEIPTNSKSAAKERLHLVLMQDRANVSADFLDLMKQEIIEVIKKYIEVDEEAIDVRLTNKENEDGTNGAPALYANIPILNIKNEARKVDAKDSKKIEVKQNEESKKEEKDSTKNEEQEEKEEVESIIEEDSEEEENIEDENTTENK